MVRLKCFLNCDQILTKLRTTGLEEDCVGGVRGDEAEMTGGLHSLQIQDVARPHSAQDDFLFPKQHFLEVAGPIIIDKIGLG